MNCHGVYIESFMVKGQHDVIWGTSDPRRRHNLGQALDQFKAGLGDMFRAIQYIKHLDGGPGSLRGDMARWYVNDSQSWVSAPWPGLALDETLGP